MSLDNLRNAAQRAQNAKIAFALWFSVNYYKEGYFQAGNLLSDLSAVKAWQAGTLKETTIMAQLPERALN